MNRSLTTAFKFLPKVGRNSFMQFAFLLALPQILSAQEPLVAAVNQQYSAIAGQPFVQPALVAGGQAPYSFRVVNGTLPSGLTINSAGTIAGIPLQLGTFALVVNITDARASLITVSILVRVDSAGPVFLTNSLPPGSFGTNYRVTINTLSSLAVTFSLYEGQLPKGLELSTSGQLSGTPVEVGSFIIGIRATDSVGRSGEIRSILSIAPYVPSLQLSSLPPPSVVTGLTYKHVLSAIGGVQPYQWNLVSGRLPNGLDLSPKSGIIFGSPHVPGVFSFSVAVTDQSGVQSIRSFEIVVAEEKVLATAQVGMQYGATLNSSQQQFTQYRLSPGSNRSFPQGLTLTSDGKLFGSAPIQGIYSFNTVESRADGSNKESAWTLAVLDFENGFKVSTLGLPAAVVGRQYGQLMQATGGVGPITWSVKNGDLPTGLKLDQTGLILGIPSEVGTSDVILEARDSRGSSALINIPLMIDREGGPNITAITDAASYGAKGVAPGQLISIFGTQLGPATLLRAEVNNGLYPLAISDTKVFFDGIAAPLIFASSGQVCAIAPLRLRNNTYTIISIEHQGWRSTPIAKRVYASLPGVFTFGGTGSGPAASLNENGSVNSASNAALGGSIVVLYLNGASGQDMNTLDGSTISTARSLRLPVEIFVGGIPSEVIYAGEAPGLLAGLSQLNFRVPTRAVGAVPIVVKVGEETSPSGPTIWVK